jgi:hypothetical protein
MIPHGPYAYIMKAVYFGVAYNFIIGAANGKDAEFGSGIYVMGAGADPGYRPKFEMLPPMANGLQLRCRLQPKGKEECDTQQLSHDSKVNLCVWFYGGFAANPFSLCRFCSTNASSYVVSVRSLGATAPVGFIDGCTAHHGRHGLAGIKSAAELRIFKSHTG